MPDFNPLRITNKITDLLNGKVGELSVAGDLIGVPNARNFSREEFQRLLPSLEKVAKNIHQEAGKKMISVDVISLIPFNRPSDNIEVLIKPIGYRGDPRSFTIPLNPKPGDLTNLVEQMREMLPLT